MVRDMNQQPKRTSVSPAVPSTPPAAPSGASKPPSSPSTVPAPQPLTAVVPVAERAIAAKSRLIELLDAVRIELAHVEAGLSKTDTTGWLGDAAESTRHALAYVEELAAVLEAPSVDALGRRRRRQVHILTEALVRYAEGGADGGLAARAALTESGEAGG